MSFFVDNKSYLEQLPIETLMKILEGLSLGTVKNVALANKTLHNKLCMDNSFWLEKLRTYYPNEYQRLYSKEKIAPGTAYKQFKWCFDQFFYRNGETITKETNKIQWELYRKLYLRVKEGKLTAVAELIKNYSAYFIINQNNVDTWRLWVIGLRDYQNNAVLSQKVLDHLYQQLQELNLTIYERLIAFLLFNQKELVEANFRDANVAYVYRLGDTPLFTASQCGYFEITQHLVKQGADVNQPTNYQNGITPLYIASENGHLNVVKYLIELGADVNTVRKDNQETPLHIASKNGRLEVVKYLVEKGADINQQTRNKSTPYYIACKYDHAEVATYLMEQFEFADAIHRKSNTTGK